MDRVLVRLGGRWTPGVRLVTGLFAVSLVLGHVPGLAGPVRAHLVLVPSQALGPQPWQLLTGPLLLLGPSPLLGLLQLVFLGLLLHSIGSALEQRLGTGRFLRLCGAASLLAAVAAAAVGRPFALLRDVPVHLDGEPVFLVLLAAFAQQMGHERVSFWGMGQPVSARALSTFFLVLILGMHFVQGRWLDLAAGVAAAAVGLSAGPGGPRATLDALRQRLQSWRLRRARRRYKVLDGGLWVPPGRRPGQDRWVN